MLVGELSVGADDEVVVVDEDGRGVDLVVDCDVITSATGADAVNNLAVLDGVSDVVASEIVRLAGIRDTVADFARVIVATLVAVEDLVPVSG